MPGSAALPAAPATPAAKGMAAPARRDDRKHAGQARSVLANKTRPLRNEVQQIDARLTALATERTELEARLERGKLPAAEMADIGRRLNHGAAEVAVLEERWLALQGEIEKLTADAALQ